MKVKGTQQRIWLLDEPCIISTERRVPLQFCDAAEADSMPPRMLDKEWMCLRPPGHLSAMRAAVLNLFDWYQSFAFAIIGQRGAVLTMTPDTADTMGESCLSTNVILKGMPDLVL